MSAPPTALSPASISSSGHADGLGRRLLAFDRETGTMLERLRLRPELAAFESAVRQRVEELAAFQDEHFVQPRGVERDPATGELTVVSDFVTGSRLSDLLEAAEESALVPGVEAAFGFLLDALAALSAFHKINGSAHGTIDPARTVITPAGQLVFLESIFGVVIERLGLSPARLWTEFGIAAPPGPRTARLDAVADMAQVALSALMLVMGRPLRRNEYPDLLPALLAEVVEIAHIAGTGGFAGRVENIFRRLLPLPGRRPYGSADEALRDILQLVRREMAVETCRHALLDFVRQAEAATAPAGEPLEYDTETSHLPGNPDEPQVDPDFELTIAEQAAIDTLEILDESGAPMQFGRAAPSPDEEEEIEIDLRLDQTVALLDDGFASEDGVSSEDDGFSLEVEPSVEPGHISVEIDRSSIDLSEPAPFQLRGIDEQDEDTGDLPEERTADVAPYEELNAPEESHSEPVEAEPAPAIEEIGNPSGGTVAASEELSTEAALAVDVAAEDQEHAGPTPENPTDAVPEPAGATSDAANRSSRRRKDRKRSVRARRDKLRSSSEGQPAGPDLQPVSVIPPAPAPVPGPAPVPAPALPAPPSAGPPRASWADLPDAARAVEVPNTHPGALPAIRPAVPPTAAVPPVPVFPDPVPAWPQPAPAFAPMPVYPPIAAQPAPPVRLLAPAAKTPAPVRIKAKPPEGYAPRRHSVSAGDSVTALPYVERRVLSGPESGRPFPRKLAGAALLIVAVAIVAGRAYLPSRNVPSPAAVVTTAAETPPVPLPSVDTGEIAVETQPPGARVLLNGKYVGDSPLTVPRVEPGRHTLTIVSPAGEVKRTVRVTAGQTATLDVPIFSGWVAILAPVILDVSVNGRAIGTTESDRLMLPPGRHTLTLTNRDLGYRSVQTVDVEAGQVRPLTIEPRGAASFNAVPWAEVWLDGRKLGDTPLANVQVPAGLREFVFKHPEYGDRRVTQTIRVDQPAAISMDFTRPQVP